MVARGWSPSRRTRIACLFGVGLLLAFNPVYLVPLDIGGPAYGYEAVPVETTERSFSIDDPDGHTTLGSIRGLDCYMFDGGRRCYFDRLLYADGNRTVPERSLGDSQRSDDPYVYVDHHVFRRTAERVNGSAIRFGLAPVDADRALRDIAVPVEQAPRPVRRAVRTGEATTTGVYEDQFVRADGEVYLFTSEGLRPEEGAERSSAVWFLHGVGVAVGLGLLRRGDRLRRR